MPNNRQFTSSGAVHFSTRGEYGVRLMAELARHYGAGPVSLAEVAEHEDLPRPYLEQLVSSLRDAGLVTSTRGARGGYELTRGPGEIRMSEVLRALEGPIVPMICANEDPIHALECGRTAYCNVNVMWVRVREAIVGTLESLTLADVSRGIPPAHRQAAAGTTPTVGATTAEPAAAGKSTTALPVVGAPN